MRGPHMGLAAAEQPGSADPSGASGELGGCLGDWQANLHRLHLNDTISGRIAALSQIFNSRVTL